ncbi:DNA polymerase I [Candidatus Kuenenbacteria bacterium HGW-Kuenenbacteria-1]|uniref:DNA polymerase I n=1 Tax=Candidatus Kuenenbacteria bacterium HGW-Kuenenbacteria-1 TaxID=2013812 RepID=A0A2N1UNM0_9BACT|nr:MAG: DNA polymerase I [Candidatus Kuenenbacteria bacterium HGW-Kuenenbacteria-1]
MKFIIIDGNALLHRAWHAIPPLYTKKGELINVVYGFTMIFLKVLKDLKPTHFVVTFDKKAPTFRHEIFEKYKAQRVKQSDEFYNQIPRVKELLEAFNIPIFEKDGYEADDLIGTITNQLVILNPLIEIIIISGDLDLLQLVNKNIKVCTLKKGITETIIYDDKAVQERYGLAPKQMIDFKALRGDPSDNIIGAKGIGEKIASDLLKAFGTLEKIYEKAPEATNDQIKERIKKILLENKDEAFLSKKLVTILKDAPIQIELEKCGLEGFDQKKIIDLFQELEFKSLLSKIPEIIKIQEQENKFVGAHPCVCPENINQCLEVQPLNAYKLIDTKEEFEKFLKELEKQKAFCLDTETTSLNPFKAKLLGISFCWKKREAYYIKVQSSKFKVQSLRNILEDIKIKKYGHNIKFDMAILKEQGINLQGTDFDTMIASYLLNPGTRAHSLDNVVFTELGHQMISFEKLVGFKIPKNIDEKKLEQIMELISVQKMAEYSCEDADYTFQLVEKLTSQLKEKNLWELFQKIEMPLVPVLTQIERNGIKIDVKILEKLTEQLVIYEKQLTEKIYKIAEEKFNINSPLQLKKILFEKLKISVNGIKKIKTGISTAASELEKMKGSHLIIDSILEYREISKLKSTYSEALPKLVNLKTQRIHTSFNQTITATGRLSSSNPNLQNIPNKGKFSKEIRTAFIAEKGYKLIAADYSQIELRVIASLANDEKMIQAFNNKEDIHIRTAAEINECKLNEVSPEMRQQAKAINFGIIYGMGAYGLAQRTDISQNRAKEFIEKYFEIHKGIKNYLEEIKKMAKENGYTETLFGRRRYLPEINSKMFQIKNAAERMAVNMPIQGTAADLIKIAMIRINNKAKILLQVHDELVFEVKDNLVKETVKLIKQEMENFPETKKFKVPIKVKIKVGDNWGEMKEVKS